MLHGNDVRGPARPDEPASLAEKIARAESRLAALDAEREATAKELTALRSELSRAADAPRHPRAPEHPRTAESPRSAQEKIALFRSLFTGRADVFPKRWHNARTDRSGYAPACDNEWVRGVCEKPRVKCGECPNQAFIPVTDQVILDHLQGRHVIGVYPMLEDETCRFLAVDFDKSTWMDDVHAFVETCRSFGLEVAVERSRSGDGAHVWFFFSASVSASDARRMGCFLVTRTMECHPTLSMTSYDRLFPNQDTMPRGGFGNLIALPLQYRARQADNTVFVDDDFTSFADQWAYLVGIRRIEPARVEALAAEASISGQIIGVRIADDGETEPPWQMSPARARSAVRARAPLIDGPLPEQINAVLCQQLFIEKRDLPAPLINALKRIAAFQNPEFYKKQAMRLSTALTPRVISCATDHADYIALPRGCTSDVVELLGELGIGVVVDDERILGAPLDLTFHGTLTPTQQKMADSILAEDMGVVVAPPGTGKTVVGCHLIAARAESTLVLVHRTQLLDQWRAQLSLFLDVKPTDIGQIGGGKRKPNGRLDVAMVQSLVRRGEVDDIVADYGHVLVDECHHVPAVSFERVMREARARFVTGLTATPERRDGHHPIIGFQLGPVRFSVSPTQAAEGRQFHHELVVRHTTFQLPTSSAPGIQEVYGALTSDALRNELIVNDVLGALEEGRSPVVLTERRDHLELLADTLAPVVRHLVVLQGGMGVRQRREVIEKLSSIPDGEERLLLATGRFIGEGFDDARLDTLFLGMPVSWKGTLVQYAGRLHRAYAGKAEVRIYDYVDREVPMLARMFEKRLRGYRAMGYEVRAAEDLLTPADDGYVVEYDEDALRELGELHP